MLGREGEEAAPAGKQEQQQQEEGHQGRCVYEQVSAARARVHAMRDFDPSPSSRPFFSNLVLRDMGAPASLLRRPFLPPLPPSGTHIR